MKRNGSTEIKVKIEKKNPLKNYESDKKENIVGCKNERKS